MTLYIIPFAHKFELTNHKISIPYNPKSTNIDTLEKFAFTTTLNEEMKSINRNYQELQMVVNSAFHEEMKSINRNYEELQLINGRQKFVSGRNEVN